MALSNYYCPRCFKTLTKHQEYRVLNHRGHYCPDCDRYMDSGHYLPAVRTSSECEKFLDAAGADETLTSGWWHYTTDPDWLTSVTRSGVWVHVGTRKSADAMRRHRLKADRPGGRRYTYLLRLSKAAVVSPYILKDRNSWPNHLDDRWVNFALLPDDVNVSRYLNAFEAPGEISLLVDPRVIEVVERRTVGGLTSAR